MNEKDITWLSLITSAIVLVCVLWLWALEARADEVMLEGGAHLSSGSGVGGFVRYTSDIRCPWDGRLGAAVGAWDGEYRNSVYAINCNWIMDEKFDLVFGGALRKYDIPEDVNNDLNFELGVRFRLKETKSGGFYAWLYHYSNGEVLGLGSDNHEDNIAGIGYITTVGEIKRLASKLFTNTEKSIEF